MRALLQACDTGRSDPVHVLVPEAEVWALLDVPGQGPEAVLRSRFVVPVQWRVPQLPPTPAKIVRLRTNRTVSLPGMAGQEGDAAGSLRYDRSPQAPDAD